MRRLLAIASVVAGVAWACGEPDAAQSAGGDDAADADAGPTWLGDAGVLARAPVARPLHELVGIASNPGDMPLGPTPDEAALRKGYFDAALDLGGVKIRRDFRWVEIEPDRGRFVFDAYDALVAEAESRGVQLLATLDYGTPWASRASVGGRDTFPPDDPDDFAAFARTAATRWRGKVAAWEIWNEPNNGWRFWEPQTSGDPAAYAALLARASTAIHDAAPEARVLLGGTVFTPQLIEGAIPWLEEAYAAAPDLARSFDVAGIHAYAQYPPERPPEIGELYDPPLEQKVQMHAWQLDRHGGGGEPIWITEMGWPVSGSVDAATQARFTVRATILAAHAGASGIFFYTLRDGSEPDKFPPEDAFGLLAHDGTPKPSYVALRALIRTVGERWATLDAAPLTGLPDDGHAVVFRGASGPDVVCVWTVSTPTATVTLTTGGDVTGQDGGARGSVAAGASLTIGPDVTYVTRR